MTIRCLLSVWVCLGLTAACGGGQPPAETPADESGSGGDTKPEASSAASAETPKAEEKKAEPAEPAYDAANPKNVLLHEGTAFMLNHRESDIGKKAEEACEKKSKGDVAKQANCLSAAINKMDREGFMFDEDEEGKWWFIRIGIVKGAEIEYNRVLAEPGEPSGKRITIKTSGPDKTAHKKGSVPAELQFEVPDEYRIILTDPDRGMLVFEPKMGLFNE